MIPGLSGGHEEILTTLSRNVWILVLRLTLDLLEFLWGVALIGLYLKSLLSTGSLEAVSLSWWMQSESARG